MALEMAGPAGLLALGGAMIGVFVVLGIILYIYGAVVWMTIAKKLNYDKPWIAWIPIVNLFLLPILAKKTWVWGFLLFVPIANIIFILVWLWKIYERRNYPGWLALVPLLAFIPLIGAIAGIANLVIMGMVAWVDRK